MDADRFDTLTRSLTAARSRRRAVAAALSGALGLLGLTQRDDMAAARSGKCKPKCGECATCNKGKCKKTNNGQKCKKGKCQAKGNGATCSVGTCQSGSCTAAAAPRICPPVCPVCQTCNAATGLCAVDTSDNGEAGTGCPAPNVCCSGECCDGVPTGVRQCNAAGACATCAEVCDANCVFCLGLAQGGTRCVDNFASACDIPCSSAAQCTTAYPTCVKSLTLRSDNRTFPLCAGTGFCASTVPCT